MSVLLLSWDGVLGNVRSVISIEMLGKHKNAREQSDKKLAKQSGNNRIHTVSSPKLPTYLVLPQSQGQRQDKPDVPVCLPPF